MQRFYSVNIEAGGSYIVGGYNSLIYVAPAGQSAVSGLYLAEGGSVSTIKAADSRLSVSWDAGIKFTCNFQTVTNLRILVFRIQ